MLKTSKASASLRKNKRFLTRIALSIIVFGAVISAFFFTAKGYLNSSKEYIVTLAKDGFFPETLTIQKGDTITFATSQKKPFWPASNLHPSHEIYPEFDPKRPIEPEERWSFRFEKEGEWKYHDHLAPVWRGTIVVEKKSKYPPDQENSKTNENCKNVGSGQGECWETLVDRTLKEKGLDPALELIENFYKTEPQFAKACHDMVHKAGAAAYNLFHEGKNFTLTPKTSVCEYGFFHGFTETLAAKGGSVKEAGDFCLTVSKKLGSELPDVVWQCYHGLGHGSVDVHDKTIWGDERAMIRQALKLCDGVADTPQKLFRCGTGVFDSISIAYFSHNYGLEMKKEDPFWLCREQTNDELKKACYVSMNPALMVLNDLNFLEAASYIERITPKEHAVFAMGSLALPVFWVQHVVGGDRARDIEAFYNEKGIETCRALKEHLRLPCIQSIAHALTWHEASETQWQKGMAFCLSQSLSRQEEATCFQSLVSTLRAMYPVNKANEICQRFEKPYRKYCQQ